MSDSPRLATFPGAGARLNSLLFQRRITRSQLATLAGVSRETVAQALRDRMSPRTAARMAEVLGVDPRAILEGGSTSPPREPSPTRAVREGDDTHEGRGWLGPADDDDLTPLDEERGPSELADFVGEMDRLVRTLSTVGELPVEAKIAILNGFEEAARVAGRRLPPEYWDLRRTVVDSATEGGADEASGEAEPR